MSNGKRIFHESKFLQTAPFNQPRDGGKRLHKGTDYGTYWLPIKQYPPLDDGHVLRVVTTEMVGAPRGLLVEVTWEQHDLGIIFQHAGSILVKTGQTVNKCTPLCTTGKTGKNDKGKPVSTGIHAHIEAYKISTKERVDFEELDFEEMEEDMTKDEVIEIIKSLNPIYEKLEDVPDWGRPTVSKMITQGKIKPDPKTKRIDMSRDLLRAIVILDR